MRAMPFFPPDLFDADRTVLLDVLREVGTAKEQRFVLGERTRRFERLLSESLGGAHVVACGSGTSALGMVLHAMDVRPGVEVVVPAFGCVPLAATVVNLGATPVFADIDPDTMVADPDEVERAITGRTGVIVAVHLCSVMADMPRFRALAASYGVRLVEDAAVAHGGVLGGVPAGLWGEAGVFSFVQVTPFGMPGEGGAVVTRDADLAETTRVLRDHGQDGRRVGYSSRFDEVQAAFQLHRLATLPERLARRAGIAEYYTERFAALADRGIRPPPARRDGRCHDVYPLRADRREALRTHLARHGIGSHVHYPIPLPRQPAFAPLVPPGRTWPHAEHASAHVLAIPSYPHLTDAEVEHIADTVVGFAG